jgi:hypothetical protein
MKRNRVLVLVAGVLAVFVSVLGARYAGRQHALRLAQQAQQKAEAEREARQEAEAAQTRQAEEEARQAGLAKARQARQAQLDTLESHCGELQGKWDADPRKNKPGIELSEEEYKEVMAEGDAKDDCWKQAHALEEKIDPERTFCDAHYKEWRSDEMLFGGLATPDTRRALAAMRGERQLTNEEDASLMASPKMQEAMAEHKALAKRCGW